MISLGTDDRLLSRYLAPFGPTAAASARVECTEEDVQAARRAWAMRVIDEYRSVVVFGELLALLARAEAPVACLAAVQQLGVDELRHTRRCLDALAHVDPGYRPRMDLAELGLPASDAAPLSFAFEVVVREIVVAEAESLVSLRAYRGATADPVLRKVLQELLKDEVRHAAAGRSLATELALLLQPGELRRLQAHLRPRVELDLLSLRDGYRRTARGGPGRCLGASIRPDELGPAPDYGGIDWCWGGAL